MEVNLKECKFIGRGTHGSAYLTKDGKVIKVCKKKESAKEEYLVMKKGKDSKYFPKVYHYHDNYLIRDYVGGQCAKRYIAKNGLSRKLANNLISLIENFIELDFSRLDIRLMHVFVQKDESILIIDPAANCTKKASYPQHMIKNLKSLGVLKTFFEVLNKKDPELCKEWASKAKVHFK